MDFGLFNTGTHFTPMAESPGTPNTVVGSFWKRRLTFRTMRRSTRSRIWVGTISGSAGANSPNRQAWTPKSYCYPP